MVAERNPGQPQDGKGLGSGGPADHQPAKVPAAPLDPRSPEEQRVGRAIVNAIYHGATAKQLAERFAGGSLDGLLGLFDTCCDQRMLRHMLRIAQYETAFRLERLKRQAMLRLFDMAMGKIVPESGSADSVREIDFQRRAIGSFLRINAFPSAREIRADQRITSPGQTPPMQDMSHRGIVQSWLRDQRRAENLAAAKESTWSSDDEGSASSDDDDEAAVDVENSSGESAAPPVPTPGDPAAAPTNDATHASGARGEAPVAKADLSVRTPADPAKGQGNGRRDARAAAPGGADSQRPSRIILAGGGGFLRSAEGLGAPRSGRKGNGNDARASNDHPP